VLRLTPTEHLTQNEIDAALLVQWDEFNPQHQPRIEWPAHVSVARSFLDQLARSKGVQAELLAAYQQALTAAERLDHAADRASTLAELAGRIEADAAEARDEARMERLASTVRRMAEAGDVAFAR